MGIQEGRWDCRYCGTKGILGRHKQCLNCGRPRPEGVKFYLPEDAPEVTDEKQLAEAEAGADWACEHCGASNSIQNDFCTQCGAAKGSSPTQAVKEYSLSAVPRGGDEAPPPPPPPPPPQRKRSHFFGRAVATGALILSVGTGAFVFVAPKEIPVVVQGSSWERTVQVEEYKTVTEEGWELPAGARVKSQRREIHHYDKILDRYETRTRQVSERVQTGTTTRVCGKRDLGNGYFKDVTCTEPVYQTRYRTETYREPIYRDEPVYRTKYTYEIEKWVPTRTVRAGGTQQQPFWPNFNLKKNERQGQRTETYTVKFADKEGKVYPAKLNQNEWDDFKIGQNHKVKVSNIGDRVEVVKPSQK